jgi:hypothetical protein
MVIIYVINVINYLRGFMKLLKRKKKTTKANSKEENEVKSKTKIDKTWEELYSEKYREYTPSKEIDWDRFKAKIEENYKRFPLWNENKGKPSNTMRDLEDMLSDFNKVDTSKRKGCYPRIED